jgi:hypothetical protein
MITDNTIEGSGTIALCIISYGNDSAGSFGGPMPVSESGDSDGVVNAAFRDAICSEILLSFVPLLLLFCSSTAISVFEILFT